MGDSFEMNFLNWTVALFLTLTASAVFAGRYLIETEDSDYQDLEPKGLRCKKIGDKIKRLCSTPEDRKKNKCEYPEKSFKKYCGSGLRCKKIGDKIKRPCSTPEDRKKNKCEYPEKSFKKYCGSGSDYYVCVSDPCPWGK